MTASKQNSTEPEPVAPEIPASDSNDQLRLAAAKRAAAETLATPSRDQRGQVTR